MFASYWIIDCAIIRRDALIWSFYGIRISLREMLWVILISLLASLISRFIQMSYLVMCKSTTVAISTRLLHWVLQVITRTNLRVIRALINSAGTNKGPWVISIILLHHLNDLIASSPSLQDRLSNNPTAAVVRSIRSSSVVKRTLNRRIVIRCGAAIFSNTKCWPCLLNLVDLPVQIAGIIEALLTALSNYAWTMS